MKRLMSLMVLSVAAFAGGGLMNEHNLTTFVNYLYHKQQVGNVISLDSITSTPPAALPPTLPSAPGAVDPSAANPLAAAPPASIPATPQPLLNTPPQPGTALANSPQAVASPAPVVAPPQLNGSQLPPDPNNQVPSTPPPAISIDWPDKSSVTYRATPVTPSDLSASNTAPADPQINAAQNQPLPSAAPPPLSAQIHSADAPTVPPPSMSPPSSTQNFPKSDPAINRAAYNNQPQTVAPPQPDTSWPDIHRKLKSLGVSRFEWSGTSDGRITFRCELASADASAPQRFEAEGDSPQAAAQLALRRIVLFNATRRANNRSAQPQIQNQVAAQPVDNIPISNSRRIPQFSTPIPPADIPAPSSEPPPPPPDLPN